MDREFRDLAERCQAWKPRWGVVLGSGLGEVVDGLGAAERVSYEDVVALPASTAPGHAGQFVRSKIGEVPVMIAQGRIHLYEGHSAYTATALVRAMHAVGVESILFTNAAGALNQDFELSWMVIEDHLNLTGTSPLVGFPEFTDMSEAYDPGFRERILSVAAQNGISMNRGVYAANLGPQYETPAEVRMLQRLGADAVGMSTALEVIQARALGLGVAGISRLTNWGAGLTEEGLNHEDVMEQGRQSIGELETLIRGLVTD